MIRPLYTGLALAVVVAAGTVALGVWNANVLDDELPPSTSERFANYSPTLLSSAVSSDTTVLFFHATWCATCKLLVDDITANLADIPDNTRILLVDFDTATSLKQRYGVTLQHTLVQVDSDGQALGMWHLTRTLDELLSELDGTT